MRLFTITLAFLAFLGCQSTEQTGKSDVEPPNILLFIADDWSFPHAGVYGDNTVQTPNFDALAQGGMLFTNAYCASPSCAPSRASILTGRYPHENGVAGNLWSEFPTELPTYTEELETAGYRTGYDQKGWGPGDWAASGRTQDPTGAHRADFRDFVEAAGDNDQPFCFWFGSRDPHRKYERNLGALMGMKADSVRVPPIFPDLPCVRNDILDYFAEIERLDRHLGQAVELLRARGELDNTLIIVTSDNGMPFPRAKANLYDWGTRMPFVAHWPARIAAGTVHEGYVNLASLAPTFVAAAGLDVPADMTLPSLLPVLFGGADAGAKEVLLERERHAQVRADSGSYAMRGLRNDSFLYIRNYYPERWPAGDPELVRSVGAYGDVDNSITKMLIMAGAQPAGDTTDYFRQTFAKRPAEEFYHLGSDPHQVRNLAQDPTFTAALKKHRTRLRAKLRETNDPREKDPQTAFWDEARYTPSYPPNGFDLDTYIADYRYKRVKKGTKFDDLPCLPIPEPSGVQ